MMMDMQKLEDDQYKRALDIKQGGKYRDSFEKAKANENWDQKLQEISAGFLKAESLQDIGKWQEKLNSLFNAIYEKLTAPGLEAFIDWIETCTTDKGNVRKFQDFIKRDYETYADKIENILDFQDKIPEENSLLFVKLWNNISEKIQKQVKEFVGKPEYFANGINDFLDTWGREYADLTKIEEFSYVDQGAFYQSGDENVKNFYAPIVKGILEKSQGVTQEDVEEYNGSLGRFAQARVDAIRKCVKTLWDTRIAEDEDGNLQSVFRSFMKGLFSSRSSNISESIQDFLDKEWPKEVFEPYVFVASFYDQDSGYKFSDERIGNWKSTFLKLENAEALLNVLSRYTDLQSRKQEFEQLSEQSCKDEIKATIHRLKKDIEDFKQKEKEVADGIVAFFRAFLQTYESKDSMLDTICTTQELKQQSNEIREMLSDLNAGVDALHSEDEDLLLVCLNDETLISMLDKTEEISNKLKVILGQSGMEKAILWLDSLASDKGVVDVTEESFDSENIKALLEKGLIELTCKKCY